MRKSLGHTKHFGLGVAALVLIALPAHAQTPIGGAVIIQNDVQGEINAKQLRLAKGDEVFRDELVRTGEQSMAKIVLTDQTNVSVGPSSQVKLDRFVMNDAQTAKEVVFDAGKGAFRFFSGNSASSAYRVNTPQATIGVRGTIYDVRVEATRTLITLQDGAVNVCTRKTNACADLNQPGQSVIVNEDSIEEVKAPGAAPWTFAENCPANPAATGDFCGKTTNFALKPVTPPPPPTKRTQLKQAPVERVDAPPRTRTRVVRERPVRERVYVERPQRPRVRVARPNYYDEPVIYDEPPRVRPPRPYYPGDMGYYPPRPHWNDGGGMRPPRGPRPDGGGARPPSGPRPDGGGWRPPGRPGKPPVIGKVPGVRGPMIGGRGSDVRGGGGFPLGGGRMNIR